MLKFLLLILAFSTLFIFFAFKSKSKMDAFTNDILKRKWENPEKIKSLVEEVISVDNPKNINILSKFGGKPNLPKNISWPEYEKKPMVFLAQINLKEVSEFDSNKILPQNGILFFFAFFKTPESEFGAEYSFSFKKEEFKVLYFDGNLNEIYEVEFPKSLPKEYWFKEQKIGFDLNYQIPPTTETWKVNSKKLSTKDLQEYNNYLLADENRYEETILGTPYPIQYGVDYDWALNYLGTQEENDQNKKKIELLRPEFINLLSFTMLGKFDKIGISNCYFGIRKEDLINKRFENVVFILQDT